MKFIVTNLLLLFSITLNAQDSFYDYIELGEFKIAYTDSIIYDQNWQYNQFNYSGPTPVFLQIWYPIQNINSGKRSLKFEEFQKSQVNQDLESVYDHLIKHIDSSYLKSAFQSYKNGGQDSKLPVDFGNHSEVEVYELLKNIRTASYREPLNRKLDFQLFFTTTDPRVLLMKAI